MNRTVRLVETTLRDGSYEIDFQFTAEETAFLASALDRAGFRYIELCHGFGFGTARWKSSKPKVRSGTADEAHLEAAQSVIEQAAYGVILVVGPQYTAVEDLSILTRYGASFVRLAYVPDNIGDPFCLQYIDRAKQLGLTVSINLMQTYAMPVAQVAASAQECKRRGADWFYVVDSAGGMTPADVQEYVHAIVDASGLEVGLHAHNNSGLAVANCLAAVSAGATLVDGTLQGIGRATGNPPTEQMLLLLQRMGHESNVDRDQVFRLGELARAYFAERGNDPTHYVSGAQRVHSRNVPPVLRAAVERGRAPREYLYRVGQEAWKLGWSAKESMPKELLDQVGETCPPLADPTPPDKMVTALARALETRSGNTLAAHCEELFSRGVKRRKPTVLHLVSAAQCPFRGALPWENGELVGLTLPVTAALTGTVPDDRRPEILLVDEALSGPDPVAPRTHRLRHSFRALLVDAATDLIAQLGETAVQVDLTGAASAQLAARLRERDLPFQDKLDPSRAPRILITDGDGAPDLRATDTVVLLGGAGTALVDRARKVGARVLRPMGAVQISSRAASLVALARRLAQPLTPQRVGELSVVDLQVGAAQGEVVVDDLIAPANIVDAGDQAMAKIVRPLATARARSLLNGKGAL